MSTPDAKSSILGSSDLTEDVILEILLRLPVKSLVRFKCVCKQWYAIVESQSFIEQHFGHMSNDERVLVRHYKHNEDHHAYALFVDGTCSGFEEPAHLQMPNMISQVLGPVNGVFCLVGESNNLALLNPATRQLKPLPRLPEVIPNLLGFGLDLLSRDYKVVSATCIWDARAYACHPTVFVYNLGSDSWRNLGDAGCSGSSILVSSSLCNIYLNGVYYWAIGDICFNGILAFDMTTEKYQEIQVPDCLKLKCGHLTIHGDSIAVLSYELPGSVCEVWVMEKEGSWNRVAVIGPYQDMAWPLCLWKNNELLIEIDTLFLMLCNIFTNKRQLTQTRAKKHGGFLPFVFSYKESLVSIKGKGDNCMLWDGSPDILSIAWPNGNY